MAIVKKLSETYGITVLSVMHNLDLAAMFSDKVILINNHKIYAHGSGVEILTKKNIETVYETPVNVGQINNRLNINLEIPDVDVSSYMKG